MRTGPALALALLLGCWAAPPAAAVDTEPPRVVVRVDGDAAPDADDAAARLVPVRGPGRSGSSDGVQLVRPRAGYSASEFAGDLAAAAGRGARPSGP